MKMRKEYDWICSKDGCKVSNFYNRDICRKCNYPRHGLTLPIKESKVGDWFCETNDCHERNFGFRKNCRRCGQQNSKVRKQSTIALVTYNMCKLRI